MVSQTWASTSRSATIRRTNRGAPAATRKPGGRRVRSDRHGGRAAPGRNAHGPVMSEEMWISTTGKSPRRRPPSVGERSRGGRVGARLVVGASGRGPGGAGRGRWAPCAGWWGEAGGRQADRGRRVQAGAAAGAGRPGPDRAPDYATWPRAFRRRGCFSSRAVLGWGNARAAWARRGRRGIGRRWPARSAAMSFIRPLQVGH